MNIDTLNTGNAVYAVATAPNDANGVVAFGGAEKALRFWDSRAQHAEQLVRAQWVFVYFPQILHPPPKMSPVDNLAE